MIRALFIPLGVVFALLLARPASAEEPKKDPPKPDNDFFLKLLPYLEQDHFRLLRGATSPADRIGVPLDRISSEQANQLKLTKGQGRVVGEVKKGSAADKAGMRQRDLLLEVNGKPIPAGDEEFGKMLSGAKATLGVFRDGKRFELKDVALAANDPPRIRTFIAPSDELRGFEFRHLHGLTRPAPELPKGYEVISREPVLTTVFREADRFTVRLQEGTLAITVVGKKGSLEVIKVQEGGSAERFGSLDKLPPEYRDKAARLLKIGDEGASAPVPAPAPALSSDLGLIPPKYRAAYKELTKRLEEAQQGAAKDKK